MPVLVAGDKVRTEAEALTLAASLFPDQGRADRFFVDVPRKNLRSSARSRRHSLSAVRAAYGTTSRLSVLFLLVKAKESANHGTSVSTRSYGLGLLAAHPF